MKKTAIVSCYFQHNYGSMLQAYATQMALDKLGYENETIDISGFNGEIKKAKLLYFAKASLTSDILLSKLGMARNVMIKKFSKNQYAQLSKVRAEKFDAFSRKQFRLSSKYNSKAELGNKCKDNYSNVLVGSDQLWLPGNIAADYYTLNFVPGTVNSIAYATSFGQSSLPKDSAKKAEVFLKRIKHIGVREESGQKLVKEIANRDVPVVCDPTLLFTGDEWMAIQQKEPIVKGKYILCYFLGNNPPHREFAKRLKEATGCKIIALTHLDEFVKSDEGYADETPYDIDPADFLNLIRNGEYVPPISYDSLKGDLEGAFSNHDNDDYELQNRIIACHGVGCDLRMYVQQSDFTIHSTPERLDQILKLDESCDYFYKIRIPQQIRKQLLAQLDAMGFRESSIYPDMEHIAKEQADSHFNF